MKNLKSGLIIGFSALVFTGCTLFGTPEETQPDLNNNPIEKTRTEESMPNPPQQAPPVIKEVQNVETVETDDIDAIFDELDSINFDDADLFSF